MYSGTPLDILTISGQTVSVYTTNQINIGINTYVIKATDSKNTALTNIDLILTVKITCIVTGLSVEPTTIANVTHNLTTS